MPASKGLLMAWSDWRPQPLPAGFSFAARLPSRDRLFYLMDLDALVLVSHPEPCQFWLTIGFLWGTSPKYSF